ncbi:MAG TPA: diaminopimelate epimerase, partial [Acidimicrobiales bacterium]|nr:diaminopimelate epimerase [Acidimicrobiales bacterium]
MQLTKHHGLGNDFLVLLDLEGTTPIDAGLAQAVCDRRRGVGADGLIRVSPGSGGTDVAMTLLNSDGGRAEMSGNGIRCLAHALARSQGVERATYDITTDAGPRRVEIELSDGGRTAWSTADMGVLRAAPARDPGLGAEASMGVDVGNPHLVARFRDE